MTTPSKDKDIFKFIVEKGCLKQKVFQNTYSTLKIFKKVLEKMVKQYHHSNIKSEFKIPFEYKDKGKFELEAKFAGDVLIFMMHTNIFQFPREHFIHKTSYVREDTSRSFCGIINIYNFLGDSFKYNRINDIGYLIGRIFINKDMHFYIDGKKELRILHNNFMNSVMDEKNAEKIIELAIRYTINFDLLTPHYDNVKEITLHEIVSTLDSMTLKTGKRLGFKFLADLAEEE